MADSDARIFFLALDEAFKIHENLDKVLHRFFELVETSFTSRLDDAILSVYIIVGLGVLYFYKEELKNFQASFTWLKRGMLLFISSLFLDVVGHNKEFLSPLISNAETLDEVHHWYTTVEEIPKVFASGAMIICFYGCFKIAQKLKTKSIKSQ